MPRFPEREVGAAVVVQFGDDFGRESFLALDQQVADLVARKKVRVALDLSNLEMITSDGIGLLVPMHDKCSAVGGKLVVFGLAPRALRVVKLASLDTFFNLRPDEKGAVEALGGPAAPAAAAAQPARKKPRSGRIPSSPRLDAEEARVRTLIRKLIRSRMHALILERSAAKGKISLKRMASELGASAGSLKRPFDALVSAGVLKPAGGEEFSYSPSDELKGEMSFFLERWTNPDMRSRLAAWLLAEEKTGGA